MEAELNALRMRTNQKFADFLIDFNTLSSQVNWGDHAVGGTGPHIVELR